MGGSGDGVVVVGVDGVVGVGDATSALILPPRKGSMSPVAPSRSFDEAVMTFELDARRKDAALFSCIDVELSVDLAVARAVAQQPQTCT